MTPKQKIDLMIQSLQLAKEEIEYAEKYLKIKESDENFYSWGHMGRENRSPNGTLIRENLKQVGRIANIVAKDIVLSPYCDSLYK